MSAMMPEEIIAGASADLSAIKVTIKPPRMIGKRTRPLIPILEMSASKPSAGTAPLPDAITAKANRTHHQLR